MLSDEAVKEFQELCKAEFGIDISFEEASREAKNFLDLYKFLSKGQNEHGTNMAHRPSSK